MLWRLGQLRFQVPVRSSGICEDSLILCPKNTGEVYIGMPPKKAGFRNGCFKERYPKKHKEILLL